MFKVNHLNRALVVGLSLAVVTASVFATDPVYGSAEIDAAVTSATALKTAMITVAAGLLAWKIGARLVSKFIR